MFNTGKSHDISSWPKELKEESELRPAWGLKYDFLGRMLHGLNKYYLIVGIRIPDFLFEIRYPNMELEFCNDLVENGKNSVLYFTCRHTWPIYLQSIKKEQQYREHINEIIAHQFPAVIPGFKAEENKKDQYDMNIFHSPGLYVDSDGNPLYPTTTISTPTTKPIITTTSNCGRCKPRLNRSLTDLLTTPQPPNSKTKLPPRIRNNNTKRTDVNNQSNRNNDTKRIPTITRNNNTKRNLTNNRNNDTKNRPINNRPRHRQDQIRNRPESTLNNGRPHLANSNKKDSSKIGSRGNLTELLKMELPNWPMYENQSDHFNQSNYDDGPLTPEDLELLFRLSRQPRHSNDEIQNMIQNLTDENLRNMLSMENLTYSSSKQRNKRKKFTLGDLMLKIANILNPHSVTFKPSTTIPPSTLPTARSWEREAMFRNWQESRRRRKRRTTLPIIADLTTSQFDKTTQVLVDTTNLISEIFTEKSNNEEITQPTIPDKIIKDFRENVEILRLKTEQNTQKLTTTVLPEIVTEMFNLEATSEEIQQIISTVSSLSTIQDQKVMNSDQSEPDITDYTEPELDPFIRRTEIPFQYTTLSERENKKTNPRRSRIESNNSRRNNNRRHQSNRRRNNNRRTIRPRATRNPISDKTTDRNRRLYGWEQADFIEDIDKKVGSPNIGARPTLVPNNSTEYQQNISNLNTNSTESFSKGKLRKKRFLSTLFDLAFRGFDFYLDHRKSKKMSKAFNVLNKHQQQLRKEIITIRGEMMSIAEASLKEFQTLRKELHKHQLEIKRLGTQILHIQNYLVKAEEDIANNADAIRFLTIMTSVLLINMERYLATYELIISELDHFLDALDNLSNGLLSHTVINPSVLNSMLEHVQLQLDKYYPDYTLVLNKVHQLYNLPFIHFSYNNGTIAIQIPLFIKPKLQEPLFLYDLTSVPVPYHMNPEMIDSTESKYTYTWVKPEKELLAMSSETYIALDPRHLEHCFKFRNNYFCEQMQLIKHNSEHTCESAIFWHESVNSIKEKCNILYYPNLIPTPTVLDANNLLLLVGLPTPWISYCSHEDQIPDPIQGGEYVIINKADLCLCSITAGPWFIQENMMYCNMTNEPSTKINLHYTINMAVYVYMHETLVQNNEVNDTMLLLTYDTRDPPEVELIAEDPTDVAEDNDQLEEIPLQKVTKALALRQPLYLGKDDKSLSISKPKTWWKGRNAIFGFILIGSIFGIAGTIFGIFAYYRLFGLRSQFKIFNGIFNKKILGLQVANTMIKDSHCYSHFSPSEVTVTVGLNFLDYLKIVASCLTVIIILFIMYKIFNYIFHYMKIHRLSDFKYNLLNYKLLDASEIYILFTTASFERVVAVYIGTHVGSPDMITTYGLLHPRDIYYKTGMLFDHVILCTKFELKIKGKRVYFPTTIQIPFYKKLEILFKLRREKLMIRLISVYTATGAIIPLTSFLDLSYYKKCYPTIKTLIRSNSLSEPVASTSGVNNPTYSSIEELNSLELTPMPTGSHKQLPSSNLTTPSNSSLDLHRSVVALTELKESTPKSKTQLTHVKSKI